MRVPADLRAQLIAHARAEAPDECCGLVGLRDGEAVLYEPVANAVASPLRFEMEPSGQLRAWQRIEDEGLELAIFHSHTRSAPAPSQTDINMARLWPGAAWLIAGLAGDEPELRAWSLDGGRAREIPLAPD